MFSSVSCVAEELFISIEVASSNCEVFNISNPAEPDFGRSESVDLVEEVRRASYARAAPGILGWADLHSEEVFVTLL